MKTVTEVSLVVPPCLLHVVLEGLRHGQFLLGIPPAPLLLSHKLALSAVLTVSTPTAAPEQNTRGRAEEAGLDCGYDVLGQLVEVLGLHVVVGGVELQERRRARGRHDCLLGEAAERGAAGGPGLSFNDVKASFVLEFFYVLQSNGNLCRSVRARMVMANVKSGNLTSHCREMPRHY